MSVCMYTTLFSKSDSPGLSISLHMHIVTGIKLEFFLLEQICYAIISIKNTFSVNWRKTDCRPSLRKKRSTKTANEQNTFLPAKPPTKPVSVCIDQHTLLSSSHQENFGTCNRSTVEKRRSFQHLVNVMDSVFVCYNASKKNPLQTHVPVPDIWNLTDQYNYCLRISWFLTTTHKHCRLKKKNKKNW